MSDPFDVLNNLKDEQLDKINFKKDAQKVRQSKEWSKNRNELLDDIKYCEWCGKEPDRFDIHHTWGRSFSRQWFKAVNEAYINSNAYDKSTTNNRIHCPECNKKNYYSRKTKSPEYRCNDCNTEFEEPEKVDGGFAIKSEKFNNKPYTTYEFHKKKSEWAVENKETVFEYFMDRYNLLLDEYRGLEENQVVAICNKCHYKEEKTNLKRCKNCGVNWYKPRSYGENMCWDCIVDKEGLEECSKCEDGWYKKDRYDFCKDCR